MEMFRRFDFSLIFLCCLTILEQSKGENVNESAVAAVNSILHDRIVGGQIIDIRKASYQVSVQYNGNHICGGSVIAENIILTAAHCIISWNPRLFRIRAGSNEHKYGGTVVQVKRIIKHPNYNRYTFDYDVAVLILVQKLRLGDTIRPIELATNNVIESNSYAVVSGWGKEAYNGPTSLFLKQVKVPLITNRQCNYLYWGRVTERMICALDLDKGGKDACQGDSGGPLATLDGKTLLGIVSWGEGCAEANHPGVYASVPAFVPWIKLVITTNRS